MPEQKPYIELFHFNRETLEGGDPHLTKMVRAIKALESFGYEFHFNSKGHFDDLPPVSKEAQIIIGGFIWEMCVQDRVEKLRKMGYVNAKANPEISFSFKTNYTINPDKLDKTLSEILKGMEDELFNQE